MSPRLAKRLRYFFTENAALPLNPLNAMYWQCKISKSIFHKILGIGVFHKIGGFSGNPHFVIPQCGIHSYFQQRFCSKVRRGRGSGEKPINAFKKTIFSSNTSSSDENISDIHASSCMLWYIAIYSSTSEWTANWGIIGLEAASSLRSGVLSWTTIHSYINTNKASTNTNINITIKKASRASSISWLVISLTPCN